MAKLMRCTTPHWQGNKFIDAGTVLPKGHREVIPIYFEEFDTGEASEAEPEPEADPEPKRGPGRPLGSKNKSKDSGFDA